MRGVVVSGKGLRERRLDACLTQTELARRIGCTSSVISGVERGAYGTRLMGKIDLVLSGGVVELEKRTPEMQELHEIYVRKWAKSRPMVLQRG